LSGNKVKDAREVSEKITTDLSAQIVFDEFGINLGEVLVNYINKHMAETVVMAEIL